MGLDTLASRSPDDVVLSDEDTAAFEETGIDLCGGMGSDGVTSIRGKVYAGLVLEATGISLYEAWLAPEVVARLSRALDARSAVDLADLWDSIDGRGGSGHSSVETAGLKTFFDVCAERGLGLIGWW
jgi:hypothetical protein